MSRHKKQAAPTIRCAIYTRKSSEEGLELEFNSLDAQRISQADVDAAFADFDNVWNALSSREQAQVLALLVARVEFDPADSTLAITFHPSAIRTLAQGSVEDAA